jgi:2-hydroxy-6-oxonona-2,4-dienedioate hydrolase
VPDVKIRRHWVVGGFAAALLAGGGAIWAAYAHDMETAKVRLQGRSSVVESPYGPIEYAVVGEGRPVLAIHGSGGGFDQALEMMGPLTDRGYRLIAPSRFGYLRSGRPANASPAVQADAFAWLMSSMGEEKVIVAGGSAGALPALQFAIRHPEKTEALVLLVPATYSPARQPGQSAMGGPIGETVVLSLLKSDFLFWTAMKLAPGRMTRALLATEPAVVEAAGEMEKARVRAILTHILPVSRRARGLLDDTHWAGSPPEYPLEQITAPVLAVSLRDDLYGTYASAEYTAARVKTGKLVGFETGGHVFAGRDQQVWDAVAEFLADQHRTQKQNRFTTRTIASDAQIARE